MFTAGADAVMLDLEDAVPPQRKADGARDGRRRAGSSARAGRAWVRVNAARTDLRARPISPRSPSTRYGIRIPKVESPDDVRVGGRPGAGQADHLRDRERPRACWPRRRSPPRRGSGHLAMGGVDLQRDLNTDRRQRCRPCTRGSHLVVCSRAAGIEPPIDSVFPHLDDDDGLRAQAEFARSLGFFGKSAIHPRQLPILHDVFTPTGAGAGLGAGGAGRRSTPPTAAALRLPDGEFVDLPVAQRARRVLQLARPCAGARRGTSERACELTGITARARWS